MIRIGPITIARTETVEAYEDVAHDATVLHQRVWYGGEDPMRAWPGIMEADAQLSEALSHLPDQS